MRLTDADVLKDAVEVVRCKNCASWGNRVRSCKVGTSFNGKSDGNYLGDCIQFGIMTLPNFYCAWGERKDEVGKC